MTGFSFANPLFLWLLILVPGIVVWYILRQQKTTASLQVSGLQQFEKAGPTFRNHLRHIMFGAQVTAILLLIIVLA
jgi:Ca-activated chloride channel family protein